MADTSDTADTFPPGEYGIVEMFGHDRMLGRCAEVERFGTKMLAIEPVFKDRLLPVVFVGGGALFRFTPCSADFAFQKQPKEDWMLPDCVRAQLPQGVLPAPSRSVHDAHEDDEGEAEDVDFHEVVEPHAFTPPEGEDPWKVRVDAVEEGTMLYTDDGFTCLKLNECATVQKDDNGLFIPCAEGKHYLEGQTDDGEFYVGFSLSPFVLPSPEKAEQA
jgi:hypothetical protein